MVPSSLADPGSTPRERDHHELWTINLAMGYPVEVLPERGYRSI